MTPIEVTRAFIEKINAHTLDGIYDLMTEDHIFVDGGGAVTRGRKAMRAAWQGYFSMMPDHLITPEHVLAVGNTVGVFGKASAVRIPVMVDSSVRINGKCRLLGWPSFVMERSLIGKCMLITMP